MKCENCGNENEGDTCHECFLGTERKCRVCGTICCTADHKDRPTD